MKKEEKKIMNEESQLFSELGESPYQRFKEAFALMSIIPLLGFFYILVGKLFSLSILEGEIGFILFIIIILTVFGFLFSYSVIKKLLRHLVKYSIKLKKYDSAKSEFVAKFSHEVLSPLAIIKINMSNIMDGIMGPVNDPTNKSLGECQKCVVRIEKLVTNMLDLSKIESGRLELSRSLVDLTKLVNEEVTTAKALALKKNIALNSDLAGKAIFIWGDIDRLREVLLNLIDNAIKYTPENGTIKIKLFEEDSKVILEVSDTGPGIEADKLDKVFDKFSNVSSKEGHGLGLSITRDIIDLHRGRIWVESVVGKGTNFFVLFPKDLRVVRR